MVWKYLRLMKPKEYAVRNSLPHDRVGIDEIMRISGHHLGLGLPSKTLN